MSFYISNNSIEIPTIIKNDVFNSINELYEKLNAYGWDEMSVFDKRQWNPKLKCSGQCNATVLLVQEYFGGEIIKYPNPNGGIQKACHYFNRIKGVDIDLTSEQFESQLQYSSQKEPAYFGNKLFIYEKSAYILKLKLNLN